MEYYVIVNGQQQGPFKLEQLADMGLTPEAEVWAEGMPDWTRAGEVPELSTYFSAFPAWRAYAESCQPGMARPAAVPPHYTPQPQEQPEPENSHKVAWGVLIAVLVVLLVMIITCPNSQDHRDAVTAATQGFVNDKVDEATGNSDDVLSSLLSQGSKWFSGRAIDVFLDNNFQVRNYFICSVGKIKFNGKERTVSIGLLNHVSTFDKEDLAEAAAKVGKAEKAAEEAQQQQEVLPDVQTLPSPDDDAVLNDEKQALDTIAKGVKEAVVNSAKDWINKKINKLTKQLPDTLP